MNQVTISHNPRCSKSRQTLALVEERGIQPRVVEYLKNIPSASDIETVLEKLGISARDLLRTKEDAYKELNLSNPDLSDTDIIAAMISHPKLIERPIVITGGAARIGRPPENVLEIL